MTTKPKPCLDEKCGCCSWWMKHTGVRKPLNTSDEKAGAAIQKSILQRIVDLDAEKTALVEDNKRYAAANKELNAKANKIKVVTASDPKEKKPRGRPKGQPATVNRRPKRIDRIELNDCKECPNPKCKGKLSEKVQHEYSRVVKMKYVFTENVLFITKRRWCRKCNQLVKREIPGVPPNARISANHSATMVTLNMDGLSHGKIAKFSEEVEGVKISRSGSYRHKIAMSKRQAGKRDSIEQEILNEPYLRCDEFWWPLGKKQGYVLVALGSRSCLMKVSDTRNIEALKKFLPGYGGIVGQDSYTGWLHIGKDRQMCMIHQIRLAKKDLKYKNPKGDPLEFLTRLVRLHKQYFRADKIEDPHTRAVAANCLDHQMSELMHGEWKDDKGGTIKRYRKRYRREGHFLTTYLSENGVGVKNGNNGVEIVNRRFVAARSDGGGNRTPKGMEANSILFTVCATCKVNGRSFYEELQSSDGYG